MTEEGEIYPVDEADRMAEAMRMQEEPRMQVDVQDDEGTEEAPVKARRAPREPTEAERLRHEVTHLPYRSWCEVCIKARGRCRPHMRQSDKGEPNAAPKIALDYFFLGGEDMEAVENPMLVALDQETGNR